MVAFGHTAIGAGVGLLTYQLIGQTSSPAVGSVVALGAGFTSHYLADLVPHGHFFRLKNYLPEIVLTIIFDLLCGVALFLGAAYYHFGLSVQLVYILMGITGSQLPDILDNLVYLKLLPATPLLKQEHKLHIKTHWHGAEKKMLMIGGRDLWQLATVFSVLYFILTSKT